ncbi:chaperone protein DnaJ 1 [Betaproteobacteria bacterium]|nr:chaperone protein DnaJ 1 [Betaproteobacteria bacterium]GHT96436.1 chaperone protein DnaJ 1 [Betaproteobacteria bacterium]GHT99156.1 chaperone protein DnaJ 1 [Betaproteobacteria bacterium]GHU13460.1 chaperone protein DnaJ 1 [Betaproteobacteria bacterium]GHU21456.1 chaperone protein DnaJ 1 [Betaproteobacteria bacterium]
MDIPEARKLLGVTSRTSAAAIKKAFRQLAMQWHPDRNPAPEAGEKFARLAAACNLLLEQESSSAKANAAPDKGEDLRQDFELDLEQACRGGQAEVGVDKRTECDACAGSGYQEVALSQQCPTCHGSGRIRRKHGLTNCPDCEGRGYTRRIRCPECEGKGERLARSVFAVTLTPGMLSGDELRLEGKGHPAPDPAGQPGDLLLRIVLRPHALFGVDGNDITIDRPVSTFILLIGGTVTVPTPVGPRDIDVPPGLPTLREIAIPEAGIPARGKRAAGALKVRLLPGLPTVSSPTLTKLYRSLQQEIERTQPHCCPELDAWEQRWLSAR